MLQNQPKTKGVVQKTMVQLMKMVAEILLRLQESGKVWEA